MNAAARVNDFENRMNEQDEMSMYCYRKAMECGRVSDWQGYDRWIAKHYQHKKVAQFYYGKCIGM